MTAARRPQPSRRAWNRRAFTLIELLVATTVLVVMVAFVVLLVDRATAVTSAGHERMDVDGQVRMVFDRMTTDFSKLVRRDDVDRVFNDEQNNGSMDFYSEVAGYLPSPQPSGPVRGSSIVAYRMNSLHQLERGSRALDWTQSVQLPNKLPILEDKDYQVLGDDVFRFEVAYLVKEDPAATPPRPTPTVMKKAPATLANVRAIIVGVALLDDKVRAKLPTPDALAQLAAKLPGVTDAPTATAPTDPLTIWTPLVADSATLGRAAAVSAKVASGVHVYQRYFYLQ